MKPLPDAGVQHRPVKSSNIASVGHDPETQTLHVKFHSGGHYMYHKVDPRHFNLFLAAKSKGKYFQEHVRDKFKFTKIK